MDGFEERAFPVGRTWMDGLNKWFEKNVFLSGLNLELLVFFLFWEGFMGF